MHQFCDGYVPFIFSIIYTMYQRSLLHYVKSAPVDLIQSERLNLCWCIIFALV